MITSLLLSALVVSGLAWWRMLILVLVFVAPVPLLTVVVSCSLLQRRKVDHAMPVARFADAVSGDLRAGSSLRQALVNACQSVPPPSGDVANVEELSVLELADVIGHRFRALGDELRLTINVAHRSGASAAEIFDEIGSLALAQSETQHEVRIAVAPGRATGLILLAAPMVFLAGQFATGGLSSLLTTPVQRWSMLIGACLVGLGAAGAGLILVKAGE